MSPTFDGESKTSQEAEAWILGMKKYFQIHDYSRNERDRINIYNLNGQASIWWENFMQVKGIKERRVSWDQFKKYFEEKDLSYRYYDNKRKEFNELNLGQKSMEKHVHKFLDLLRHVDYIKYERIKIQIFLGSLPQNFRDRIEFVNPSTLNESI